MKSFPLLILSLWASALLGQYVDKPISIDFLQENKVSTLSIHVMPISAFKLGAFNHYPRLHLGVQLDRGHFSYLLDFEYGNNSWLTPARSPYIYYGFRPEIQYHFVRNKSGSVYIGLEVLSSYAERSMGRSSYLSTNGKRYRFDGALQKRVKIAPIIKIGGVQEINERLYADFYFGFGRGNKNLAYLNQVNQMISEIEPTLEWFSSSDISAEGNKGIIAFALGGRIGYKFSTQ